MLSPENADCYLLEDAYLVGALLGGSFHQELGSQQAYTTIAVNGLSQHSHTGMTFGVNSDVLPIDPVVMSTGLVHTSGTYWH